MSARKKKDVNLSPAAYEKAIQKIINELEKGKRMKLNKENFNHLKGKSQPDKVIWWLEQYGKITNAQCHEIFGIRHAACVIRDLRKRFKKQGNKYEIINNRKEGCNRFGEPCHWDEYVLIKNRRNNNDNRKNDCSN